jgi:hypothetical protein
LRNERRERATRSDQIKSGGHTPAAHYCYTIRASNNNVPSHVQED